MGVTIMDLVGGGGGVGFEGGGMGRVEVMMDR